MAPYKQLSNRNAASPEYCMGIFEPDNLLVTGNGTVKIGDFSLSQVFEGTTHAPCRILGLITRFIQISFGLNDCVFDIPWFKLEMGIYLSAPKTEKCSEDGENSRLGYGLSSMQGWRATMEAAVCYHSILH
ncbi:Protein phosphatase 2C [Forsythia ovata]|uniref:Protein phosphatase 2C n=1 Tax=Forsythia ovata TaxID=205694 RepID=A0ABD1QMA2_9LAMI